MKLTKSKLLKITTGKLSELGYQEFTDTQTGASGLFIKLINQEYFLTLGLILSNHYERRFSASYYLSKTTRWSSVWGDIPRESYQRISLLLTNEERKSLLSEEYSKDGVVDAWWHGDEEREIGNFFRIVQITEKRFVNQEDLFSKIENSSEVRELVSYSSGVIAMMTQAKVNEQRDYKFIPDKSVDDVPLDWFKASEIVLFNQKGILNANTVKLLAVDAWRQYRVKQTQSLKN